MRKLIIASIISALIVAMGFSVTLGRGRAALDAPASYPGLTAGGQSATVTFGGAVRSYYLYVPTEIAAHPDIAVPLVIALHGGLGSGQQLANTSQLNVEADRLGFVVAYPDGLLLPTATGAYVQTWNGGGCCGPAMATGVDDVGFVASVISSLEAATAINQSKVIVGGHSNGAILAWRIACDRADILTAAVIVEGSLERPSCAPSRGVALVQVHGDDDEFLPLEGGIGPKSFEQTVFTSAAASQAMWTTAQHCASPVPSTADHLTITTWPACAGGVASKLIVIAEGTHAWAGADPAKSAPFLGVPSPYFSATGVFSDLVAAPAPASVNGIAEYSQLEPDEAAARHHSSTANTLAFAALAAGGALLLAAGGWYARRHWLT